ncbi:MAG: Fic family protein [Halolamina sp.]
MKHIDTMPAAPRLALKEKILAEAQQYDDPYHRAAVLLWHLISTHVLEEANKRTAWTMAIQVLHRHGIDPALPEDEVARVVRRHGLFTVDELATWLETGEIDADRLPEE